MRTAGFVKMKIEKKAKEQTERRGYAAEERTYQYLGEKGMSQIEFVKEQVSPRVSSVTGGERERILLLIRL